MAMIQQLINHKRAVVVAAAGCGKTEIIVDAVAQSTGGRQLVLTHTNAGVSSLTKRFKRKCVDVSKYNLQTIASFSAEYAYAFPMLSKVPPKDAYSGSSGQRSDVIRPVIPVGSGQVFRSDPASRSDGIRPMHPSGCPRYLKEQFVLVYQKSAGYQICTASL